MKENADIFANFIFQGVSNTIPTSIFSVALKLANITLIFKKASKNSTENCRPESILPNVSKIYEPLLF